VKVRILASYGADLDYAVKELERKVNNVLKELESRKCSIHKIELEHGMGDNSFSILALIVYTCPEDVRV